MKQRRLRRGTIGGALCLRLGRSPLHACTACAAGGYTAASIRSFCEAHQRGQIPQHREYGFLEHCLREDLNVSAQRTMAVMHPVKLTVTNHPQGQSETFTVENNPNRSQPGHP